MNTFILIHGEAQSGKNTFAQLLKNELEKYYDKVYMDMYAGKLKTLAETCFPDVWNYMKSEYSKIPTSILHDLRENYDVDLSWLKKLDHDNWQEDKTPFTRKFLQDLGTDLLKYHVDNSYHFNSVVNKYKNIDNAIILVTDYRFDDEYTAFDDLNIDNCKVITIKVERDIDNSSDIYTHASEKGISIPFNYVVDNNGTLADLTDSAIVITELLCVEN